jgi:hypothetical protein
VRVFRDFNATTGPCPICGNSQHGEAVLVRKDGTARDGIEEATQVHLACLNLRIVAPWRKGKEGEWLIYQIFDKR